MKATTTSSSTPEAAAAAVAASTADEQGGGGDLHEQAGVDGCNPLVERALEDIDHQRSSTMGGGGGRRGKKGQCPTCGTQLFKVGLFGKKKPLNERGKVFQGICLKCFQQNIDLKDFAGLSEMPQSFTVPKVLSIPQLRRPSGGNMTVVSGITLDVALVNEADLGDLDSADFEERRSPVWKRDPLPKLSAIANANNNKNAHHLPRMETLSDVSGGEDHRRTSGRGSAKGPLQQPQRELRPPPQPTAEPPFPPDTAQANVEPNEESKTEPGPVTPCLEVVEDRKKPGAPVDETARPLSEPAEGVDTNGGGGAAAAAAATVVPSDAGTPPPRDLTDGESTTCDDAEAVPQLEDIPKYVALVHMPECEKKIKVAALKALAASVWEHGFAAEVAFARSHGLIVLTKLMWDDISDHIMQLAILNLLVALVAPRDGKNIRAVLVGEGIDGCVDALLITMHTLIANEALQQTGCTILCFLASACSVEPRVNDGTASGAVLTVLSAMEAHQQSVAIQEWGVRTLYHQCIFSKNAEGNKRTLACRTLSSGERGSQIILRSFHAAPSSPILADRLCKLYWCLTASEDLAQRLEPVADVFVNLLTLIQQVRANPDASPAIEAAFGAISNFSKTEENCRIINADKAIALALDVMCLHKESVGVLTESCCVIANLAAAAQDIDAVIESEALETIVEAMVLHASDPYIIDEGLRALVSLAGLSEAAREKLVNLDLCRKILEVLRQAKESVPLQVSTCRLISLVIRGRNVIPGVLREILTSICQCMAVHLESERVQDSACSSLRVLSGQAGNRTTIKSSEVIDLILTAMEHYRRSKLIQLNACCILWNVAAVPEGNDIFGGKCIAPIVEAMKAHLETDAVLEMACSALWTLIHGSEDIKRRLVETDGSIEALTCVMVMHPEVPALLEKVVGVLSSLSSSQDLASKVISNQTMDAVLDVVRNNGSAIFLLHFCILFLKNAVVVNPELSRSVKESIPIVLTALKSSNSNPDFQHGACVFLWVVALSSPECKSEIVASDGMTILMLVLEGTQVQAVQDAALGALGALALERESL